MMSSSTWEKSLCVINDYISNMYFQLIWKYKEK